MVKMKGNPKFQKKRVRNKNGNMQTVYKRRKATTKKKTTKRKR